MDPAWLTGTVKRGSSRGRTLGFPTANLELPAGTPPPPPGIYAAWARLGAHPPLPAAVHVGPRPTFGDATPTVEVHLIGFPDRDLYHEQLAVQFVEKLRDVQTFATTAELTRAIAGDCAKTIAILRAKEHDI